MTMAPSRKYWRTVGMGHPCLHCGRRHAVQPLRVCYDCELELHLDPIDEAWETAAEQRFFHPEDPEAVAAEEEAWAVLVEFLSSRKVRTNPAAKFETVDRYRQIRVARLAGEKIGEVRAEFRRQPRTVGELRAALRGVDADVELNWEHDGVRVEAPTVWTTGRSTVVDLSSRPRDGAGAVR